MKNSQSSEINQKLVYGAVGFGLGVVSVWLLSNLAFTNNMNMMGMMGHQSNSWYRLPNSNSLDAHFIEQMIPHHEDAITMSNLALQRASQPEIKQLAKNIIDAQTKEINQMKSWYREWYGVAVPQNGPVMMGHSMVQSSAGMHMGMMGNDTDKKRLEQAANFDKTFIEEMIPHHQMAVMMATMLKRTSNRSEMTTLADDIIEGQTKEINQMRQWYKTWGY